MRARRRSARNARRCLERASVLDQIQPKARARSRAPWRCSKPGSQIAGTSSRRESSPSTPRIDAIRSCTPNGANPLTFCASAICTSQPQRSKHVRARTARRFIDSIAAIHRAAGPLTQLDQPHQPGQARLASGATRAPSPRPPRPHRAGNSPAAYELRSKPACNMSTGPPSARSLDDTPELANHEGGPPSWHSLPNAVNPRPPRRTSGHGGR